jgi:hypothetical protein
MIVGMDIVKCGVVIMGIDGVSIRGILIDGIPPLPLPYENDDSDPIPIIMKNPMVTIMITQIQKHDKLTFCFLGCARYGSN